VSTPQIVSGLDDWLDLDDDGVRGQRPGGANRPGRRPSYKWLTVPGLSLPTTAPAHIDRSIHIQLRRRRTT